MQQRTPEAPTVQVMAQPVTRPTRRVWYRWVSSILAATLYLSMGLAAPWRAWARGVTHTGAAPAFDPVMIYWMLACFAHFALSPGHWFATRMIARPGGANWVSNTAVSLLSLLAALITLTWGPVASANVLTALSISSKTSNVRYTHEL